MFLLSIAWIAFSVYHNFISSTIPETLGTNIAPITPSFNTDAIEQLKKRKRIAPFSPIRIVQTPTPTSTQSSSSQISPTPTPTISSQSTVSPTP